MTILYGFEKRWLRSFAWQALVCTKKAYLFPKGEGRNFLKWKKNAKIKILIWHVVVKCLKNGIGQGFNFHVIIPAHSAFYLKFY